MSSNKPQKKKPDAPNEASKPESPERLTLVATKPREPSPAEQIEAYFYNPLAVVVLAMGVHAHEPGPSEGNVAYPDKTLFDLKRRLDLARLELAELARQAAGSTADRIMLETSVAAGEAIDAVQSWVMLATIERSGSAEDVPDQPLTVPPSVLSQLQALNRSGKRLALAWQEMDTRARVVQAADSTGSRGGPGTSREAARIRRLNGPSTVDVRATFTWVKGMPQSSEVKATELAKRLGKKRQYLSRHEQKRSTPVSNDPKLVVARRSGNKSNSSAFYSRESVLAWMALMFDLG